MPGAKPHIRPTLSRWLTMQATHTVTAMLEPAVRLCSTTDTSRCTSTEPTP